MNQQTFTPLDFFRAGVRSLEIIKNNPNFTGYEIVTGFPIGEGNRFGVALIATSVGPVLLGLDLHNPPTEENTFISDPLIFSADKDAEVQKIIDKVKGSKAYIEADMVSIA